MPAPDYFLLFVAPLNRLGVRYMISGSIAAMFYGEPRFTQDVDFVVYLTDKDISGIASVFQPPGFYVPPIETLLAEIRREQRGHFNVIHSGSGFKADMYLAGRDELNAWGLRFKRAVQYEGETAILAPPEYVIVRKLEYYREGRSEKHLRDIRSMIAVSGDQLDKPALTDWIKRLGLEAEWALVSD
jgi:hypothetical protein